MGKLIGYLRPRSVHTADMNFIVSRSGFWVFKANIIYKSECRGLFVKIRFHQFDQLVNDNYEAEQPTVSARDLHEALEINTRFNDWFSRMAEYGFENGVDFNLLKNEKVRLEGN